LDSKLAVSKLPHVLTLTPFYPIEEDDAQGCFVAESLTALEAAGIQNTVFSVRPFYREKINPGKSAPPAFWRRFFTLPGGVGLPSAGNFLALRLLHEVRDLHRKNPFDLIHAHAALPCGHAALQLANKLGIPLVVTVHGLDVFFTNQVSGIWGDWCKRISRRVYRSAAKTICISGKVRDCISHEMSADAEVVYNGVDPGIFTPSKKIEGQDFILSVGNLIPIKGHELLLRAFANVRERFPKLKCEIIGDGPKRAHLEALARELAIADHVHFRGRQSRAAVAAAMGQCTLFALPSSYEGLGCVYLEAMAAGKPVIACSGQGIEEVIQHGNNGLLISPNSLPEMTNALVRVLESADLGSRMGEEARRTVLKGFAFSHQAERLVQLYRECIA
jgi:teichuronic acid biosynthesis glycosyltransferase TuaC